MNIHESAQAYLERILMVRERKDIVYSIDIAHELDFSNPSVSVAMKRLRENGHIQMDTEGLPPWSALHRIERNHLWHLRLNMAETGYIAAKIFQKIELDFLAFSVLY